VISCGHIDSATKHSAVEVLPAGKSEFTCPPVCLRSVIAAIAFVTLIGLLVLFQLSLAFGAPWGRFAWGGQHPGVLPLGSRIASGVSILI